MKQSGFTLVELAIVLMIIGLLIGGILRGQELLDNARITATIQQVKSYKGAVVTFRDSYAALPGDVLLATSRIPGCNTDNNCGNGNGDGLVGEGVTTSGTNQLGTGNPQRETSYFWKHLALVHLISGVKPNAEFTATKAAWGESHPAAKIGGGFTVFHSIEIGDWGTGLIARLQNGTTHTAGGQEGRGVLSPIKARQIDLKIDDGLPNRGDVAADSSNSNCDPGSRYANTEQKNCIMYFNID